MKREKCRKHEARGAAYQWLAEQLGIGTDECHIGMFDVEQCNRVVDLCLRYRDRGIRKAG